MTLSVTYDKTSGEITVSSDVKAITVEVNDNATQDDSSELVFEVVVNTTAYEAAESSMEIFETPED
jgi:hypothetical protein